jgi:hypothetical protein
VGRLNGLDEERKTTVLAAISELENKAPCSQVLYRDTAILELKVKDWSKAAHGWQKLIGREVSRGEVSRFQIKRLT